MQADKLKHQGEPYAYCETIAAYKWHIRKLDERGLKPSGIAGRPALTLCGMDARWDIDVRMNPASVPTCKRCQDFYLGRREAP